MKTVADHPVVQSLVTRFQRLGPESQRRWGTMSPQEMLCHLGDAAEMVLRVRPRPKPVPLRHRPVVKGFWLWTAVPWPHGVRTSPFLDPKADGTHPGDFERDRDRAIAGVRALSGAAPDTLEPAHGIFGVMSLRDWQRWAWRHTDYHLRQFGV